MGDNYTGKGLQQYVSDRQENRKPQVTDSAASIASSGSGYGYLTGIVKDCVSEPEEYVNREVEIGGKKQNLRDLIRNKSKTESKQLSSLFGNSEDLGLMPKNSIIAYVTDGSASNKGKTPVICYPFFPPHISLPVKPGEHVWLLREENHNRDIYYWLCRKSGPRQCDDVNYTHLERFSVIDGKLKQLSGEKSDARSTNSGGLFTEFESPEGLPLDIRSYASFASANPPNLPEGLDNNRLVGDAAAFREEFTCEPVPPVRKKCGDSVFQGSNNTLIHLSTEKFTPYEVDKSAFSGGAEGTPGRMPLSPAIDLCVGRKRKELEALKGSSGDTDTNGGLAIVKTKREGASAKFESYEFNKVQDLDSSNSSNDSNFDTSTSVDLDATNCGARLYLSNNCAIDTVFGSAFDVLEERGGSSAALFADHNRLVADSSLRLVNRVGESFLNFDLEGNVVIKSSIDNGQQFLSLHHNGTTRLNAKSSGEIHLAVRNDNGAPDEPYILYSELRVLLEDIVKDLSVLNALRFLLTDTSSPLMSVMSIPEVINGALTGAAGSAAANVQEGIRIEGTKDTYAKALAKIGTGNTVATRGSIASKKIFGESN